MPPNVLVDTTHATCTASSTFNDPWLGYFPCWNAMLPGNNGDWAASWVWLNHWIEVTFAGNEALYLGKVGIRNRNHIRECNLVQPTLLI